MDVRVWNPCNEDQGVSWPGNEPEGVAGMSIVDDGSLFVLVCDVCGEADDRCYYDFMDAVKAKKENGWKSRKVKGDWEDVCEDCQAAERGG